MRLDARIGEDRISFFPSTPRHATVPARQLERNRVTSPVLLAAAPAGQLPVPPEGSQVKAEDGDDGK